MSEYAAFGMKPRNVPGQAPTSCDRLHGLFELSSGDKLPETEPRAGSLRLAKKFAQGL